jgi:hypothetical protein
MRLSRYLEVPMSNYVCGLDLGQAADYSALSIIEVVRPPADP